MSENSTLFMINNFHTVPGKGRGAYGPSIILDEGFVQKVVELEFRSDESSPFYSILQDNLKSSVSERDRNLARIVFYKDSWLIRSMHLGHDCACFSFDSNTLSKLDRNSFRDIRYTSHNIDSSHYGATIVSTWLLWFNSIITYTDFETPFTM